MRTASGRSAGRTDGETAARCVVSESAVKAHVGRVLAEIGARDRAQAVIFAYDQGIACPGAG
jgi:DNA-binding NarL/FixJ family response regulator